jgi:hypothetical protein
VFVGRDLKSDQDVPEPSVAEIAAEPGEIDASFDAERGIILVNCYGKWSPAQIDAVFAHTHSLINDMRTSLNRVRVLVDRRLAVLQSDATIQRLKEHTERVYAPDDRIAVLVDSSLSKMRLRSQIDPWAHKLFISESAANLWLNAHDRA